jgi:hypothetical protein
MRLTLERIKLAYERTGLRFGIGYEMSDDAFCPLYAVGQDMGIEWADVLNYEDSQAFYRAFDSGEWSDLLGSSAKVIDSMKAAYDLGIKCRLLYFVHLGL